MPRPVARGVLVRPEPDGYRRRTRAYTRGAECAWYGWEGLALGVIAQAVKDARRGSQEAAQWLEAQEIPLGK